MVAFLTNLEFLQGNILFALPYATMSWGLMGIFEFSDFDSFLFGFLLVLGVTSLLHYLIKSEGFDYQKLILSEARVNVPIPLRSNHLGEIVIEVDGSNKFFAAKPFDKIMKPIPKNSKVRIIEFNNNVAMVSTEMKLAKEIKFKEKTGDTIIRFINSITPKSKVTGICMICFGNLISSRSGFTCPSCVAVAHDYHIQEWIKIKGFCPNCRTNLKIENNKVINIDGDYFSSKKILIPVENKKK